jgi:selenide,water dikinase
VDLQGLFRSLEAKHNENLLVGFDTMDDAAIYRISAETALVLTADYITPVTDDPVWFGRVAAANSLSDVYAMGGRPIAVLNLCNFPARGVPLEDLGGILRGGLEKTEEAGAVLAGGHTVRDDELKYGLSVVGVVHPERFTPNSGARPGDRLVLTKPIGTGVHITGAKYGALAAERFQPVVETMATLNRVACETMLEFGVRGCTDITGFGLGGHALEMARASKVTIRIALDAVPRFPDTMALIEQGVRTGVTMSNAKLIADSVQFRDGFSDAERMLLCDPQTSGGLLISIAGGRADALVEALHARGVRDAAIIGEVLEGPPGLEIVR